MFCAVYWSAKAQWKVALGNMAIGSLGDGHNGWSNRGGNDLLGIISEGRGGGGRGQPLIDTVKDGGCEHLHLFVLVLQRRGSDLRSGSNPIGTVQNW